MKRLTLLAAMLALSACQTAPPSYEAASGPNQIGYFSTPVDDGRIAVTFLRSPRARCGGCLSTWRGLAAPQNVAAGPRICLWIQGWRPRRIAQAPRRSSAR